MNKHEVIREIQDRLNEMKPPTSDQLCDAYSLVS